MQQLNPSEISDIIKGRIQGLDVTAEAQNEGTIVGVSDGIVRIHGLADAQYGEMIEFDGGLYGMALNLERDSVGVVVLGEYDSLTEGMTSYAPGQNLNTGQIQAGTYATCICFENPWRPRRDRVS